MTTMKKYTVHKPQQNGATEYNPGDTRELSEADAAHLVALGALSLEGEDPVERQPAVLHTFGQHPASDKSVFIEPIALKAAATDTVQSPAAASKSARAK